MERYQRIKLLGKGTYGKVYQVADILTGQIKALKQNRASNDKEGVPVASLREISLVKYLEHENIVKLEETFQERQKLCCIFEFIELDLYKYQVS